MDAYLRGYYGYKNFGDEMLFFGVVQRILKNYTIDTLYVEAGDKKWMEEWITRNGELRTPAYRGHVENGEFTRGSSRIRIVEIKQHRRKILTHIINFLGAGKYKRLFKFFGGGEVLSDERPFPHDGRNIPLLFHYVVRKRKFVLLGGIGTPKKWRTRILYRLLLPRAQKIIIRDATSYEAVKQLGYKAELYKDFAETVIKNHPTQENKIGQYVLININKKMFNDKHINAIKSFCTKHSDSKKIFFPCDIGDDAIYYSALKKEIPDLLYYDRTKKTLAESLLLFYHSRGGIGCRLHFLLPLKLYGKEFEAIPYADKINKLILK